MEQGNVLRQRVRNACIKELVSIPLEQGNVLRLKGTVEAGKIIGVSIPLEQGNVLRR